MISLMLRYLFPKRGLWSVPRVLSAEYERTDMTRDQQLIMMAGLARDPQAAQSVFDKLVIEHGDKVYETIEFHLRRQYARTLEQRFWSMVRRILGEKEPRKYVERADKKREPRL